MILSSLLHRSERQATPAEQLRALALNPPVQASLPVALGPLVHPALSTGKALGLFAELVSVLSVATAPVADWDGATRLAHQRFEQRAGDIVGEMLHGSPWTRAVA